MAKLHIQVNDRSLDWNDENSSRKPLPCNGCGNTTRGRADLESPNRHFANLPYCVACAMDIGFGKAQK